MGDATCGPSNALQNFQKHASVDRTLQQDRFISRQPPAQGFRSQNSRDGILDPEFAAFEANLGGPALPNVQHPAQTHFGAPAQAPVTSPSANWASDFQNLHISGPAAPQLQNVPVAQMGWQNEFLNQQAEQRGPAFHSQTRPVQSHGYQPAFAPSRSIYNSSMNSMNMQPAHQGVGTEQNTEQHQFDDSAFEAAFAQARADLELQEHEAVSAEAEKKEEIEPEPLPQTLGTVHEEIRIGSDTISQTDQNPQTQTHDADALAQTAGELLESVRHEQSPKFQQSNFLALMRRIRDREVQVEGDEFRETVQSLHPGGRHYPGQSFPEILSYRPTV
ncbi:peroxin-20 Pex20-Penicillium chrysogenum [Penicillium chermesinum]|nr:peroxin-20 Pex20-Penicillium chrysogenum [Penicillium chermesinum]